MNRRQSGSRDSSRKLLADYAMVFDMMGQLAGFATEQEQVEKIFDLFMMMCGPRRMCYLPFVDGVAGRPVCRPACADETVVRQQLESLEGEYSLTPVGAGFLFRVQHGDETLAIIELDSVSAPELNDSYLNLALNIQAVIGLAIANARLYQAELAGRERLQNYADRLALLHEIGLSLNRESDRGRLLKRVLTGAAELTGSGLGAMILVEGRSPRVIATYQAPWCRQSPQDWTELAEFMGRRVEEVTAADSGDVTVMDAELFFSEAGLTTAWQSLSGQLVIGTLRDSRGRARGYFVLGARSGGHGYVDDDKELVGLLAAQSSVALISAENFEREHLVAEALLTSLLPRTPRREDIEVGLMYRSAGHNRIGGDFYEFIELGGSQVAVAMGDVCGKGLQAATYNAMIKYMLRAYITDDLDPGLCLSRLNRAVYEEMPLDRFITLGLAIIDTGTSDIIYSSAGHPHPIVYTNSEVAELNVPGTVPLGVTHDTAYPNLETHINSRGSLLMYTDGIIEARSPEDVQFGHERLMQAFAHRVEMPAQQIADKLLARVMEFTQGELKDDAALLVLRARRRVS